MSDYIRRADAIEVISKHGDLPFAWWKMICRELQDLPSADAVPIHEDGTLEVKVPNAQKVGRVLVMDTESHIGGGLFYPADAVQGEWIWRTDIPIGDGRTSAGYICSNCGKDYWHGNMFNYCPSCGARMENK